MTRNDTDRDDEIDALLHAARSEEPPVPSALMRRVLEDAARMQPPPAPRHTAAGMWTSLLQTLGGWPAFGSLAAASCVGFWIGLSPPEGIIDPAEVFFAPQGDAFGEAAELSGFGWDVQEG